MTLRRTFSAINVADYTTHHRRESAPTNTCKESSKKHPWVGTSNGTAELTDNKKYPSSNEDRLPTIDLRKWGCNHGCQCKASGEGRNARINGYLTDAEII